METHKNKQIVTTILVIAAVVLVVCAIVFFSKKSSSTSASDATTYQSGSKLSNTAAAEPTTSTNNPTHTSAAASSTGGYKDGTYSATADYYTPEDTDTIKVTLAVKDGTVTSVTSTTTTSSRESRQYDSAFLNAYKSYVVGKKLSNLNLDRVSGASLTTGGFNDALDTIRQQAQA